MSQIRRAAALLGLSLALTSCAGLSSHLPDLHPQRPPPEVCAAAAAEPRLPDNAGLPVAVTDAEKAASAAFLSWVGQLGDWGRALKARAEKTAAWCGA